MKFDTDSRLILYKPDHLTVVTVGEDVDVHFQTQTGHNFGTHGKVEFTDDGGVSWVTQAENQEFFNAGESGEVHYGFTISNASPSDKCRVRVTSVSNPSVTVTSDFFKVNPE